jgi:hypothetical protein
MDDAHWDDEDATSTIASGWWWKWHTWLYHFVTRVLHIPPMVSRGRLDIGADDLGFATWYTIFMCAWPLSWRHGRHQRLQDQIAEQWQRALLRDSTAAATSSDLIDNGTTTPRTTTTIGPEIIVELSARSLLDLVLRVERYPAGSEIIIAPPINVP